MKRITIKQLFTDPQSYADQSITVAGWARTIRASNAFGFIELNDGSYLKNLQVVIEADKLENYKELAERWRGVCRSRHLCADARSQAAL